MAVYAPLANLHRVGPPTSVPMWVSATAQRLGYRVTRLLDANRSDAAANGMAAREVVLEVLQECIDKGRAAGTTVGVLRIDIDELDRVNEALSLAAGDLVLASVHARIAGVVGDRRLVARIAGAGFVAIVPGLRRTEDDLEVAQAIRAAASDSVLAMGHVIQPTVSIGLAYATRGMPLEHVLQNATLAVRRAKDAGGDRIECAQDDLARRAVERLELEEALRRALASDEVRAWYQPIVDFATGDVSGYEALSRWITPSGTFIPPSSFIPVAEAAGLVPEVDHLVLSQSLHLLHRLPTHQFVSVNVSPASLTHPDFLRRACRLVEAATVDMGRLHLEITETALPSNIDTVRDAMRQLRDRGAKWYFDDFGTGYSSLSNLGDLPVDGLKLDMSFTRGIDEGDETRLRLAHGLLSLAHGLELSTVAEGVETEATATILRDQGWKHGQGWLYGKAEPMLVA